MTAAAAPLLETLVENLIETSLRLQGSLRGAVPDGINGELLRCGELLGEIRQQADLAEIILPDAGTLRTRLGYLREILESNDALVREGAAYGEFALGARAGRGQDAVYSAGGRRADRPAPGALVSTRG